VLVEFGDTKVICTVSVEARRSALFCAFGVRVGFADMACCSLTGQPHAGEASRGKQGGVPWRFQRLIGRSLRARGGPENLGENPVYDCDVIQATADS